MKNQTVITVTLDAKATALVAWYSTQHARNQNDVVNAAVELQLSQIHDYFRAKDRGNYEDNAFGMEMWIADVQHRRERSARKGKSSRKRTPRSIKS